MVDSSGAIGITVSTLFFGLIAVVGFIWGAPKGPDRGVVQTMVVCTCVCLWLFYLITYMAQLHPLIAPIFKADDYFLNESLPNLIPKK